jgi:hypothetical protein
MPTGVWGITQIGVMPQIRTSSGCPWSCHAGVLPVDLFGSLAERRGFREYLAGLLASRDRNKTLTALAGAELVTGAQHQSVQRLQFFLSEPWWDSGAVNARRLELLLTDSATAPHDAGG